MAQKIFEIDGVGPVIVSKRRGSKNIRLSVNSKDQVRINLPPWLPYSVGVGFASERKEWIAKHTQGVQDLELKDGDRIGKSYRLKFIDAPAHTKLAAKLKANEIVVNIPPGTSGVALQQAAKRACERALRAEAEALLPQRLSQLAEGHGYSYKDLRIKKLTGRWGSCSNSGQIALSYYLVQLPWQLIDYVIVHELVHTRHHHHGADFWTEFKRLMPQARQLQKQIRPHKPMVQPSI